MGTHTEKDSPGILDRIGGTIVGLVLGILAGVVLSLFGLAPGDDFVIGVASLATAGFVLGALWPRPFLFVLQTLLSLVGFET